MQLILSKSFSWCSCLFSCCFRVFMCGIAWICWRRMYL